MSDAEPTPTPDAVPTPVAELAPEPAPEPQPSTWMDKVGLDTDLKSNPSIQKFKDVPTLAKSYLELQTALGKDKISLPGKDAKPEEWDAVYNRLGRPETVEGYELGEWKPPEEVPWDTSVTSKMIEKMHAHRLTKEQAQGILNDYAAIQSEVWNEHLGNIEKANEQTRTELRAKWGAAYETKMEHAKRAALREVGVNGEGLNLFDEIVLEDGRKLGDHPAIIEMFADLGERMREDAGPGPSAHRTTNTPEEAKRKLNEMLGDSTKLGILMDALHPQHKALQEVKAALEKEIYG